MDRKRTKREERAYTDLLKDLNELDWWNQNRKLKERTIPREWYTIAETTPTRPRKTRVTAAYDADMVRWFRALGHGYQARMNAVLRAYMLAVISKEIESRGDRDWKLDPI
jgi:uncharacterized protein (DUF4415 family)